MKKIVILVVSLFVLVACQENLSNEYRNPVSKASTTLVIDQHSPIQESGSPVASPILEGKEDTEIGFLHSVPPSKDGKTTVVGRIISTRDEKPIVNVSVRLAKVYREGGRGAYVLDEAFSPGTITDGDGQFVFTDINPAEYVVVVGDVKVKYAIVMNDESSVFVLKIPKEAVWDVGTLQVDF